MGSLLSAYVRLTKPTIVLLFAVTGLAAVVMEGSLLADPLKLCLVMLAMVLTAGSANALNMYFDRDIDARMARTREKRPIPLAQVEPARAAMFGLVLGAAAIGYYLWATNVLTAFLSLFTIVFYVGIYTLWLKRRTPYNIVIGGVAGSTAPLIGWAASGGGIATVAWVMFLIVFLWTPPHFWSLAIAIQDDYREAGVPMLPVTHGDRRTRIEILIYTLLLLPVSLLPWFLGRSGMVFLVGAALSGAFYLWRTVSLLREATRPAAKKLFWISILWLFALFALLFADTLLRA
ncbi:MAG: protoheme IX farnesyltransferase [Bdellovibrionales bacterium]|nr:protoheme IX farnesyltransferase [Bdellovibrionales bacterium]